ncbi:MAG: glycosyltransferase [Phycisphaerales bacterium]|nr:glycosyltransferase [Phycisphaerales bacterium]
MTASDGQHISRLEAELEEARQQQKKSEAALHALEHELQRSHEAARGLQIRVHQNADSLAQSQAELRLRMNEVRYRLGDALVRACDSPTDFLLTPARLIRLFFEGLRKRRERKRAGLTAQEQHSKSTGPEAKASPTLLNANPPMPSASRSPKSSVKAAAILDEFSHACFNDECHLISITPERWEAILREHRPDFLFVESAGQLEARGWWTPSPDNPLKALTEWCSSQRIPTVFWNKEDPPGFEHFIKPASCFDMVFTTDENCIPRYHQQLGHDRVFALPFAAQPSIHNPIDSQGGRISAFCFAGSYYAGQHKERQSDVDSLLTPALERGLHIYDRMHGRSHGDAYRFPPEYEPVIRGALSYDQMIDAYKHYAVFLNVNSVKDSPTMFSRRVFELLACGTPVLSTYARGIEQLLGPECVTMVRNREEAADEMERLMKDGALRERLAVLGQRRVFAEHTYEKRLDVIMEKIGRPIERPPQNVSVIAVACCRDDLTNTLANHQRQRYPHRELVLLLKNKISGAEDVLADLGPNARIRVFEVGKSDSMGSCLNYGTERAGYEYITWFAGNGYYAEHYLTDLMAAFRYSSADIVGKCTHYRYIQDQKCLLIHQPNREHRFVESLSGSAMIAKRSVVERVRFPKEDGEAHFTETCRRQGFRLYSTDRFNHILPTDGSSQAMRGALIVDYTDAPLGHVVV